jgi:hypothetical protein
LNDLNSILNALIKLFLNFMINDKNQFIYSKREGEESIKYASKLQTLFKILMNRSFLFFVILSKYFIKE